MVVENAITQPIADLRYLKLTGGELTGNLTMPEDGWVGRGAAAGRLVFDDTSSQIEVTDTNLAVLNSTSGGVTHLTAYNLSTDAASASQVKVFTLGSGDAALIFYAGSWWSAGIDNSDSDKFKINSANALADSSTFELTTGGALTLAGGLTLGGALAMGTNAISGATSVTATSFVIGGNTLDTNEWAFLDGQDQALKVADSVEFAQVTLTGTGKAIFNAATEYLQSGAAGYLDIASDTATRFNSIIDLVATTATAGQITQAGTRILHTYGTGNLFLGGSAGNFTLTVASAVSNVGLGVNCGLSLTTGNRNMMFGVDSGRNVTSGSRNVLLGSAAGYGLTTTSFNIMVGYGAGFFETGSYKLFIDDATRASEADARVKALIYGEFAAAVDNQLLRVNGAVEMLAGQVVDQVTKSAAYTATAGDYVILCDTDTAGAAFTITLPAAASHAGRVYYVKNTGTSKFDVTVDANGAETIDGNLTQTVADHDCMLVVCDGTEWWIT